MPTASANERKMRRLKRELNAVYRMFNLAVQQRDDARTVATALAMEIKKLRKANESAAPLEVANV